MNRVISSIDSHVFMSQRHSNFNLQNLSSLRLSLIDSKFFNPIPVQDLLKTEFLIVLTEKELESHGVILIGYLDSHH